MRPRKLKRFGKGNVLQNYQETFRYRALRKLRQLDAALTVNDLRNPPGNRLEPLKGDRQGQYSIRIQQRWRICFTWDNGSARDVEIVDYH